MAGEFSRNSFKGNKRSDIEESIIVAQRFLNIFKQLHIFNQEKKDNFNAMILELSPEIRGMFASLPGGSLLQEYVDELEQKTGNTREQGPSIARAAEEPEDANILSSIIEKEPQAERTEQPQRRPEPQSQQTRTTFAPQGEVRLVADASFAREMANALAEAGVVGGGMGGGSADVQMLRRTMKENEESRRKETLEITKAITDSQLKMAEMLVQNNTLNNNSSSNNNANNIQIHTGGNFPPVEDMVSGIVKAQSELFSNMAETQTKELSAIISLALKESHQLSTQSIIDAIKAFQKENLKLLKMRRQDIETEEDDDDYAEEEFSEEDTYSDEEILQADDDSSADGSGETIIAEKKKKKKKKKKKNRDEEAANIAEAQENAEYEANTSNTPAPAPLYKSEHNLDMSLFDMDSPAEAIAQEEPSIIEEPKFFEEELTVEPEPKIDMTAIEEAAKEDSTDIFDENFLDLSYFNDIDIFSNTEDNHVFSLDSEESIADWGFGEKKEEASTVAESKPLSEPVEDAQDWNWEYEEEADIAAEPETQPKKDEEEWEWEYEEEATEAPNVPEAPIKAEAETEEEWEWEYEEEPLSTAEPQAVENVEASDEDWEWEYEEEPLTEAAPAAKPEQEATSDLDFDDGEWEWEYEEVDENAPTPPQQP